MSLSALLNKNIHSEQPIFGIEFIWQLEDFYEQKNLKKFFSLVSLDFRKDISEFMNRIEREFRDYEQLKLFLHLRSKLLDIDIGLHAYEICWSKRCKKYQSNFMERHSGRAVIVLKKFTQERPSYFLLYDIQGDNPF